MLAVDHLVSGPNRFPGGMVPHRSVQEGLLGNVCQDVAVLVLGGREVTGGESLLYPHEVGEVGDTNILPEAGSV